MMTTTDNSRRDVLVAASAGVAALGIPFAKAASAASPATAPTPSATRSSGTFTAKDGAKLFYKDWGSGKPVVFSHGWPLSADAWDAQMLFLGEHGYRVIAHDRRGHGRSEQTWAGNDMDTYADDLATLIETLDLKSVTLVGHSTGGGEVARYIGRHGTARVAKVALIASVPPQMVKSPTNPGGQPVEAFDALRAALVADRAEFYRGLLMPFFGFNKPGAKVSQGLIDAYWAQCMMGGIKSQYDCIKQFSETDFNADLKKIDVPTLVIQGDADQIVPIADASLLTAKIVKNAKLKVYPGAGHGLCATEATQINADLLAFLKS